MTDFLDSNLKYYGIFKQLVILRHSCRQNQDE